MLLLHILTCVAGQNVWRELLGLVQLGFEIPVCCITHHLSSLGFCKRFHIKIACPSIICVHTVAGSICTGLLKPVHGKPFNHHDSCSLFTPRLVIKVYIHHRCPKIHTIVLSPVDAAPFKHVGTVPCELCRHYWSESGLSGWGRADWKRPWGWPSSGSAVPYCFGRLHQAALPLQ